MGQKLQKNLLFWILCSLGIHFLYAGAISLAPDLENIKPLNKSLNSTPVEISLVSEKPQAHEENRNHQQLVRQSEAPDSLLADNKDKARFKSEKDQRVLLETRAKDVGMTKNRAQEPRFLKEAREEKEKKLNSQNEQTQNKIKLSHSGLDYSEYKPLNIKNELSAKEDFGNSTVGEALPTDVSVGSFTALNTDRFVFYSFYARIEELVRFRWESKIAEAIDSFDRNFKMKILMKKNWRSKIEFILKPNGEFDRAIIHQESGIAKFDLASVWAFKDARLFPNPPKEMIQEDGFIHLDYSFTVQLSGSGLSEN